MNRRLSIAIMALLGLQAGAQEVFDVRPLRIEPAGEDYAPVFLDSGFVMCSVRDAAGVVAFTDAETNKPLSDLYYVPFSDGKAGRPVLFSANLATPVNEGPAAFTNDHATICFTRNQVLPRKLSNMRADNGQLGLFFSRLLDGIWGAPEAFPYNKPTCSIIHPTFSLDGRTLYFASDMPGGLGGMDLYCVQRRGEGWSEPVNLGPTINGAGNEVYPRILANGSLAFASDRPAGAGGLDILIAEPTKDGWQKPRFLPAPVNSPSHDYGYTMMADGFNALFTSNRDGADAIYHAKRTVPLFRACEPQQRNNYCYELRRRPHAASAAIPVDHYWDMGDGTRIKGYHAQYCYERPGHYEVRSILVDRKSGDVFHTLSSNALDIADIRQAWVAAQDTVRTGRRFELDGTMSHLPGMTPAEYHWDMGDGSRLEGIRQQHVYKAAGVYEVKLDVLSTPDAEGVITNRCNTKTIVVIDRFRDQEDAAVVAVYQDALGKTRSFEYQELPFDEAMLHGEQLTDAVFSVQLFASKERVDVEDARFAEVRKHYRVVERYDPVFGMYTYSVGETSSAEELYEVFKKVKELQFLDAEVFALRVEQLLDLSQLDLAKVEDLNHKKLRTNAIHFEYNSAELEQGSEPVLAQIDNLLRQYPELHLVIEAHTDDVGSARFNLGLSQERAMAVVRYFTSKGVDGTRLVPVGHGKNQPIASNKTEEGRGLNRRVEFRMVVPGMSEKPEQLSNAARGRKR